MSTTTTTTMAPITPPAKPIPVTLLSGFLGVGKTSLLQHLLTATSHGSGEVVGEKNTSSPSSPSPSSSQQTQQQKPQRIAVIVNDVNSLNVDGAQIAENVVKGADARRTQLVQLQNGCICCTLRVDLLEEIVKLAQTGGIDAICIESTGVSEPINVAETFTTDFTQAVLQEADAVGVSAGEVVTAIAKLPGGLSCLAQLDCCVTVVDCFNFFHNFNTFDIVREKNTKATTTTTTTTQNQEEEEEETGTISELLIDQIEFANVIVLNKQSMVSAKEMQRIEACVRALNPAAKILHCDYGRIPPAEVLNTKLFDMSTAMNAAGWLRSLEEMTFRMGFGEDGKARLTPAPETEEFGISSFVYLRRGRAFHPERLFKLLNPYFGISQERIVEVEEDGNEDDEDDDDDEEKNGLVEATTQTTTNDIHNIYTEDDVLKARKAHPVFSGLLRSKGTFWLSTRPYNRGSWSQAGSLLSIEDNNQWAVLMADVNAAGDVVLPDDLVSDRVAMAKIRQDVAADAVWGDRRQEIVFIGEHLDHAALSALLDACLLTPKEMAELTKLKDKVEYNDPEEFQRIAAQLHVDPFEKWSNIFEGNEGGEGEEEEGDDFFNFFGEGEEGEEFDFFGEEEGEDDLNNNMLMTMTDDEHVMSD